MGCPSRSAPPCHSSSVPIYLDSSVMMFQSNSVSTSPESSVPACQGSSVSRFQCNSARQRRVSTGGNNYQDFLVITLLHKHIYALHGTHEHYTTHISLLLLNIYCYLFCTIIIKNKMSKK